MTMQRRAPLIFFVLTLGVICFLTGVHIGAKKTNSYTRNSQDSNAQAETAEALVRSTRLFTDLKTLELLRKGETDGAVSLLIGEVDYGIVSLAKQTNNSAYDTSSAAAFHMAVAYLKTNSWTRNYEPKSEIGEMARKIIGTP
jgi:hypothetical protein